MRQLLSNAGWGDVVKELTVIYGDNVQANRLCHEHFVSAGNRYIAQSYHYNREQQGNSIDIRWCDTSDNVSDIYTKSLGQQKFNKFTRLCLGHGDLYLHLEHLEATRLIMGRK